MAEQRVVRLTSAAFLFCLLTASGCGLFRQEDPDLREGIAQFAESKWTEAEVSFDRALQREPSMESHFNRGAALYRQGRLDEAGEDFRRAAGARDEAFRSRAYLDLGNTEARAGRIDEAIDAYRRALELVPGDHDARYNLEWALWMKEQGKNDGDSGDGESGEEGEEGEKDGEQEKTGDDGSRQQAKNDASNQGDQGDRDDSKGDDSKDDDSPGDETSRGEQAKNDQQQSEDESGSGDRSELEQDENDGAGERQAQNTPNPDDGESSRPHRGGEGEPSEDDSRPDESQAQAQASGGGEPNEAEDVRPARPMGRQEVSEILDALRAGEQSVPMWRFQQGERRRERGDRDKDW